MSDSYLRVIPTVPSFVPSGDKREALLAVMHRLAPGAQSIGAITSDCVAFVDAGENFELVRCPRCGTELDMAWWSDRIDEAWASRFGDLGVLLPCCQVDGSLDDLDYDWPQGFARWYVEAMNPNRNALTPPEVEALRSALGHDVRIIWAHI